jgi:UDP-glucose 4-epimerase
LLKAGHKVAVIDNLSTGCLENIEKFKDLPDFEFFEGDVRDADLMTSLIEKCDEIYHLAAAVGVNLIAQRPVHTIETNIGGTEVVLELANKFGKKVLLASTSEVYGKSEKLPFHEDDDSLLGSTRFSRWSYACSKMIDEFLGLAYYDQYGLGVVIVRLFNTVGPGQTGRYGMVIPRFVESALKNEPIVIYGSGRQCRCFGYVCDVVEAMVKLMACQNTAGHVYNIGSTEEISIEGLADKIIEMTGSKSKKKYISYQQAYGKPFDDMMRRVPSISLVRQAIGWEPKTSLEQMLQAVIESRK